MANGFDERKPGAIPLSDTDIRNNISNYRHLSYEEAAAMRQKVRNDAVEREFEAAKERHFIQEHTVIQQTSIPSQNTDFYNGQCSDFYNSNNTNIHNSQNTNFYNRQNNVNANAFQNQTYNTSDQLPYDIRVYREGNRTRQSTAIDGVWIFCIFIFISLSIVASTLRYTIPLMILSDESDKMMETYPAVEGVITDIQKDVDSILNSGKHYRLYGWKVKYSYTYDNAYYSGSQFILSSHAQELGYTSESAIGKNITVYVNPNNHFDSFIEKNNLVNQTDWIPLIYAFAIFAVGVFIEICFAKGWLTIKANNFKNSVAFGPFRI